MPAENIVNALSVEFVRGAPSDEEIAAVTVALPAVLSARAAAAAPPVGRTRPAGRLRRRHYVAPNSWKSE